jgi:hypothetical protein
MDLTRSGIELGAVWRLSGKTPLESSLRGEPLSGLDDKVVG